MMDSDERWIKCSDCLPKEEDYYLTVVVDNGNSHSMQVQRFYQKPRILKGMYGDVETHWELTQWDDYFVTHWMPLPKYPNKDSGRVRSRTPFRDDMKNCDLICMMDVFLDKEDGGEFNSSPVYFDRVQKQYVCIVKFETMPLVIYAYGETMEDLSEDLQNKLKGIVSK